VDDTDDGDDGDGNAVDDATKTLVTKIDEPSPAPSSSTRVIEGTFYDVDTRQALSNVAVTFLFDDVPIDENWLHESLATQTTGDDGKYRFVLSSPAQTGIYSLEYSRPEYTSSDDVLPEVGFYQPGTDGENDPITSLSSGIPQVEDATTFYHEFDFDLDDWSTPSSLSDGVINNHIPMQILTVNKEDITEELQQILEDDLLITVMRQSAQFSDISSNAAQRLRYGFADEVRCGAQNPGDPSGTIDVVDQNVSIATEHREKIYRCATELWITRDFAASYDRQKEFGETYSLSFNELREKRQKSSDDPEEKDDQLRGWFWGGYLSKSNVDTSTDTQGAINGYGANIGLFGAQYQNSGLMLDYYGATAIGLHSFDLNFASNRPINVDGNYTYLSLFGGLGISGDLRRADWIFTPNIRFDAAHAFAGDVKTSAKHLSDDSSVDLGAVGLSDQSVMRLTAKLAVSNDPKLANDGVGFWDGTEGLSVIEPRVFCDFDQNSSSSQCGYGIRLGFENALSDSQGRARIGTRLDYENRGSGDYSFDVVLTHRVLVDRLLADWDNQIAVTKDGMPSALSNLSWQF
jgi:hypothetical protein